MSELQQLLQTKGIVYSREVPVHSAFIMQDGSFLGLDSNSQVIACCKNVMLSHDDFKLFLIREKLVPAINERCLLSSCGAIQVNDGLFYHQFECAYMNIPSAPTEAQYSSILEWLSYLSAEAHRREVTVAYKGYLERYTFASRVDILGSLPEDIIKDIRRMSCDT